MELSDAEKKDFLQRIEELLGIDVITTEVRDDIYKTLIVACGRALFARRMEDDKSAK